MPLLKIQSNTDISTEQQDTLLHSLSGLIARSLDKSERYVMVIWEPLAPMLFAASSDPALYLEMKSIGLTEAQADALSASLCQSIFEVTAIPPERTYIEFSNAPRQFWGWNGKTF